MAAFIFQRRAYLATLVCLLAAAPTASAQLPDFGNFGGLKIGAKERVAVVAEFSQSGEATPAMLFVSATV